MDLFTGTGGIDRSIIVNNRVNKYERKVLMIGFITLNLWKLKDK